jgi:hypothetical protein
MTLKEATMACTAIRQRIEEILTEFALCAHEAEEGIAVPPPPAEVARATDAILDAICASDAGEGLDV